MLVNFNVAGDLSGLLLAYMDQSQIDLPTLRQKLGRYHANSRMPFKDWWEALEVLRDECGKPYIGLEVGGCIQPAHCGVLGYLSLSCEFLGEALMRFERYQRLLYEGNQAITKSSGGVITFYWPYDYGYSTRESDETLISSMTTYVRMLVGYEKLSPLKVGFVHKKPDNLEPYQTILGCDIEFDSPTSYVKFPEEMLRLPIVKADPALRCLLDQQADALLDVLPESDIFEQQLYKYLLRVIQDGKPTIDEVAKYMSLSPRTLHRRLQEREIHFKPLLVRTREQLAKQYLKEKRLTLSEIALLLGYSEQSAFTRAFKQWTGMTPLGFQISH